MRTAQVHLALAVGILGGAVFGVWEAHLTVVAPLGRASWAPAFLALVLMVPRRGSSWPTGNGSRPTQNRPEIRRSRTSSSSPSTPCAPDHLGSSGELRHLTPNLDQLAADGVVFRHAMTAAPWTLPAMASIFTGLEPHNHHAGLITNGRDLLGRSPLPPHVHTLATTLRAGHRTQAIVTNTYLILHYRLGEASTATRT